MPISGVNRMEASPQIKPSIAVVAEQDRAEMESALRRAIAAEELRVYYQPLVRSGDGQILGVEALLRWDSPTGPVNPGVFVPVAERSGLMVTIGRWMVRTACKQLSLWEAGGIVQDLSLHVNVSLPELIDPDTPRAFFNALESAGLRPEQLCFEVTEKQLDQGGAPAGATVEALVAGGCQPVLDDFGIGSTIEILTRYPFQFAKIDRALLDAHEAPDHWRRLLRGIGGLARSLGITLIAEGIEGEKDKVRVAALGFAHAQGYAFGKPESAADLQRSFGGERGWLSDI